MKSKSKQIQLDVSDLSSKLYLLQVTYKGMTASKKILMGKHDTRTDREVNFLSILLFIQGA